MKIRSDVFSLNGRLFRNLFVMQVLLVVPWALVFFIGIKTYLARENNMTVMQTFSRNEGHLTEAAYLTEMHNVVDASLFDEAIKAFAKELEYSGVRASVAVTECTLTTPKERKQFAMTIAGRKLKNCLQVEVAEAHI